MGASLPSEGGGVDAFVGRTRLRLARAKDKAGDRGLVSILPICLYACRWDEGKGLPACLPSLILLDF